MTPALAAYGATRRTERAADRASVALDRMFAAGPSDAMLDALMGRAEVRELPHAGEWIAIMPGSPTVRVTSLPVGKTPEEALGLLRELVRRNFGRVVENLAAWHRSQKGAGA